MTNEKNGPLYLSSCTDDEHSREKFSLYLLPVATSALIYIFFKMKGYIYFGLYIRYALNYSLLHRIIPNLK